MNKALIIGNLTADPETKTTQSGKFVCNFTVAVNRRVTRDGNPQADYFRVAAWDNLAEICQKYLAKGKKVFVSGTVGAHAYNDNNGNLMASLEISASEVEFLSPKGETQESAQQEAPAQYPQIATATAPAMTEVDLGDDLPF